MINDEPSVIKLKAATFPDLVCSILEHYSFTFTHPVTLDAGKCIHFAQNNTHIFSLLPLNYTQWTTLLDNSLIKVDFFCLCKFPNTFRALKFDSGNFYILIKRWKCMFWLWRSDVDVVNIY